MTIEKSADELLKSNSWDLTADEYDRKMDLQMLIQDCYYEPAQITPIDLGDCMNC